MQSRTTLVVAHRLSAARKQTQPFKGQKSMLRRAATRTRARPRTRSGPRPRLAKAAFEHTRVAPPRALALSWHVKDEHMKKAAQDVAENVKEDVPQDTAQDSAFGARAARALLATPPSPPPPSLSSSC